MWDCRFLATVSGVPSATIRPPSLAAFRAEVNHPIRLGDEIQIVFDDDDGVAGIHQPLQDIHQPLDIGHVQADGRLLQQEEARARAPGLARRSRNPVNKCVTSFNRCASPPLKVGLVWPSLR